ncbi:MAG: glutamate--tRNA ligase [Dehalococcoidia bacterium]|nr:glutamate--tRNA ligase [Dehalococcoidia bacterium]
MSDLVRVRFAPSPTGMPHVGNIRTALFNWLFARHHGGSFIVRIEDTDVTRRVEGAVEAILDSLRWLGLDWDEGPEVGGDYGPYLQSQRLEIYRAAAERLVKQGDAYLCYCPLERLEEMRREQVKKKQPPGYDRRCRALTEKERAELEAQGITPVVRFKTPLEGQIRFQDLIRGEVVFEAATIDDFVLLKSDGYPTYHLANVVDDHLMKISHVLRADEWLSSTPRHILLYKALGYEPPEFAHLPMILGSDRSKLSKRHGATSVIEYRDKGYLPEAVVNFLALLGWSLDDKTEIMGRDELVRNFSIERISKTGAIFSQEKLGWMNGVYMRRLSTEELVEQVVPFLDSGLPQTVKRPISRDYVRLIVPLTQERMRILSEVSELADFFFVDELDYRSVDLYLGMGLGADEQRLLEVKPGERYTGPLPYGAEKAPIALRTALEKLQALPSFDAPSLESVLRPLAAELGLKTGELFGLLRVAVTGRTAAPPLFQTMAVLGRERCLRRIGAALARLK